MPNPALYNQAQTLRGEFEDLYRPAIDRRRSRAFREPRGHAARFASADVIQASQGGLERALDPGYESRLERALGSVPGGARSAQAAEAVRAQLGALGTDADIRQTGVRGAAAGTRLEQADFANRRRARGIRSDALLNSALSIGNLFLNQGATNLASGGSFGRGIEVDPEGNAIPAEGSNFITRFFRL